MKKGYYCPKCGNLEAIKLLITTLHGKSLTVHLASQATINRPEAKICCLQCQYAGNPADFRIKRS